MERRSAARVILLVAAVFLMPLLSSAEEAVTNVTDVCIEDLAGVRLHGASKFEQKETEAPAKVMIITEDEIKKYGYRTLADILRSVSGFYVTYDRNYSYIGARGFGRTGDWNSRFLILIDGHRINENIYDSVYIGTDFIVDVDLIKRVEVISGPAFALYGPNAFLGVINIIMRRGDELKGAEISGEAATFDAYKGRFSCGNSFGSGPEILLSGSLYDSNGDPSLYFREYDSPETNSGVTHGTDYDRNYSLFSKVSYGDLTLEGAYVSRTKGVPTGSYGTDFNDRRNRTVDQSGFVDLRYQHDFGNGTELIARAFYDAYRSNGDFLYSGVVNKDLSRGEWWGGEIHFTKTFFQRHRILVGAEYQKNNRQDIRNYDENPFTLYFDEKRRSNRWALYGEDEFRILENLILNVGLRHDGYESSEETTNPRVALIYSPFERTILKALYGTAYRAPNMFELYYNDPTGNQKANPNLKPEKIETYQFVYEQFLGEHLRSNLSVFYYRIDDLIREQTDSADGFRVFDNVDEVEAKGVEVEMEGSWENGLRGRAGYSYQHARDGRTHETLVNSPRHMFKFNLIVPILRKHLFAGLEGQYMSRRKTIAGNETDDVFLLNMTLFSQGLVKGLDVSASVYNVLNKKYGDPSGIEHHQDVIEQDGRALRFKITYRF